MKLKTKSDFRKAKHKLTRSFKELGLSEARRSIRISTREKDEFDHVLEFIRTSLNDYFTREKEIKEKLKMKESLKNDCDQNIKQIKTFLLKSKRDQLKLMANFYNDKLK